MPVELGRRRNAHARDSHARDLVELPPPAAKPTVRCARIQADHASADLAVLRPSARPRRKIAVAHDVETRLSIILTRGLAACCVVVTRFRGYSPVVPEGV